MKPKINPPTQNLQVEFVPVDDLIASTSNARTHSKEQIAQIAASIREFGWTNPILARPDGVIIAGNGRLLAAHQLEMSEVPVIRLAGLTEAQCRALAIADNQLALNAGWDEELLSAQLEALDQEDFDLTLLGFPEDDLAELLARDQPVSGGLDENAVPTTPRQPVTEPGDLWILGDHRLLCGDASVASDFSRLMIDRSADLAFTDPPYNVDYQGYTDDHLKIAGDCMDSEQFQQFLSKVFQCCRGAMNPEASLYVCHASATQREFQNALEAAGFRVRCQIIWAKNTFAWGFGRYKFQHEPIFYCHVAGQTDSWYGNKSQSTLWQVDKPIANRSHPTMKPVELIERALVNSSKRGELVLDPFGGSGSTLIACERRKRRARLLELDPHYIDVIVLRWQEYTNQVAKLENADRTFDEMAVLRQRKKAA